MQISMVITHTDARVKNVEAMLTQERRRTAETQIKGVRF